MKDARDDKSFLRLAAENASSGIANLSSSLQKLSTSSLTQSRAMLDDDFGYATNRGSCS